MGDDVVLCNGTPLDYSVIHARMFRHQELQLRFVGCFGPAWMPVSIPRDDSHKFSPRGWWVWGGNHQCSLPSPSEFRPRGGRRRRTAVTLYCFPPWQEGWYSPEGGFSGSQRFRNESIRRLVVRGVGSGEPIRMSHCASPRLGEG